MSHTRARGVRMVAAIVGTTVLAAISAVPASGSTGSTYGTTPEPSWVPNGTVFAIAQSGNTVYLGGDFTSLTDPQTQVTVPRGHLAAVDATTGTLLPWDPEANDTVRALAVGSSGTIFAGGVFTRTGATSTRHLAAIKPSGSLVPGWRAAADGAVRDVLVDSQGLWVAGAFRTINGVSRSYVARLAKTTGGVVRGFNARVSGGSVFTLTRADRSLYLGGAFTHVSGKKRGFTAEVERHTGVVTRWRARRQCVHCLVFDLVVGTRRVFAAVTGKGGRLAAYSRKTGAVDWVDRADGDVQTLALVDQQVYAGGHFANLGGQPIQELVSVTAADGQVRGPLVAFTGPRHPGVWSVQPSASGLRIGGGFEVKDSQQARYAAFPTS